MDTEFMLDDMDVDSKQRESLQEIYRGAERAAGLTRQLLAFSRRQVLKSEDLILEEAINDLLRLIVRTIGEDINVEYRPSNEASMVHVDLGPIEQVLMDLCVNARDAMPHGGKLIIETGLKHFDDAFCRIRPWAQPGRYAVFSVTDTGHGMDEKVRIKIFEPFNTTTEFGKGTGLGLSTVFGIVRQHDCLIRVSSEVDQGSRFDVYLPLIEAEAPESRPDVEPELNR